MKTITYDCELTDTFGGDANYSWVRRAQITVPIVASNLAIVRRAKAELGLTGAKCRRSVIGETIELRPYGSCTVVFIIPQY
jgi:hypothetical protein